MSNNTSKIIVVSHSGLKFGFTRDVNGNGYWYCLSPKRSVFGFGIGCVVPKQYWSEIRASAIEQGNEISLFRTSPTSEEEKSESVKIYSEEKPRKSVKTSTKTDDSIKIF